MKTALAIPPACLRSHLVVLGKTGAGKSSVLRHLVEYLLSEKKRVCVIDPKGDWHGLTSSADGKRAGFEVVMFGDFKNKRSDVPMDGRAGKTVAEVVSSSSQACVLGFRGWMPGDLTRFWIDFASTLFNHNSGDLWLVIDEVHNFAPKGKIMDPEAGKCLHWTNRLASEGRGLGLKLLVASQRPQKVHNDTLTCCETLVAMRVIHEADRNAVKDWIDGCGNAAQGKTVLAELAQMRRGQAWVWSPEVGFLEKVTFPMFQTFDSFSEHATEGPRKWAEVDVASVREKLARVVEEQKANDPRTWKAEVAKLRAQVTKLEQENKNLLARKPEGLTEGDKRLIEGVKEAARELLKPMPSLQQQLERLVGAEMAVKLLPPEFQPMPDKKLRYSRDMPPFESHNRAQRPANGVSSPIGGGKRRMMIALAQRPGLSKRQLGLRAGLSSQSGTFSTYLGALRSEGHLEGPPDSMRLTAAGLDALGPYEPAPTGSALRDFWMQEVGGGAARMLAALTERPGIALSREELGEKAGISSSSGTFSTYLSKLRGLELVTSGFPIMASEELFD